MQNRVFLAYFSITAGAGGDGSCIKTIKEGRASLNRNVAMQLSKKALAAPKWDTPHQRTSSQGELCLSCHGVRFVKNDELDTRAE